MTEIYEHAKSVVIWLNPEEVEDAGVARAARLFRLIGWLYRLRLLRVYERDEQTDMKMPRATRLVTACDRYIEARSQQLGGNNTWEDGANASHVDAFNAPFLNRYFRRVWTVQEIAMAHNIRVYYGVATISWQDFVVSGLFTVKQGGFARNQASETDVFRDSELHWDLLNALESHFVLPDIYGLEALSTKASIKSTKNRYTLGTLELALIKSKGLEATEPKDKAYAMLWTFLGLEQGVGPLRDVDYAKPLDQVYTEFSTAVFVRTNGSTVQFYWVNSVPRNTALPSWVPDWSVSTSMSLFVWCQKLRDFRAARSDSLQYRIGIEGPRLLISGVRHCGMKAFIRLSAEGRQRILHNRDPGQLIEALIDAAELMRSLIEVAKSHTSYDGEESLLSAIHRIIHSQRHLHVPGTEDQQEFFARPKEVELSQSLAISVGLLRLRIFHGLSPLLDESSLSRQVIQDALEPVLLDEEMDEVLERASELPNLTPFLALVVALSPFIDLYHFLHIIVLDHRDKDMFITDQGALGMAFQGLQSDDIVALWQGCPSPMIVRKAAADGGELYRLHGPAFVDGIMLGEGWPVDKTELKEFQVV
ncbi:hypothetical protein H2200_001381 [Cladophialophora chaetospira]|uniref:Heterokaryon incompatibility domain-containing protein n=1 Tax=Cladophialophora chaetospira TaxID=386627 RepID=A0AA38XKU9_9EURO|nr:hypothetical protein H2200_001381 [Cladophialophora chaetospira]